MSSLTPQDKSTLSPRSTIHYWGSYDASYARHRIIQKGLRELGLAVQELRDQRPLPLRWLYMIGRLKQVPKDVPLIIGENSNYLLPVLAASSLTGRRVVFDTFVSLQDTFVDRVEGPRQLLLAGVGGIIDRLNSVAASVVLFDTQGTLRYFVENLGFNSKKGRVVYVGAETDLFAIQPPRLKRDGQVRVLFYGTFIPLHGIDVILEAAERLKHSRPDITFQLVGDGQERSRLMVQAERLQLANVSFGPRKVAYQELPQVIAGADICLGVFADRPKTRRVVPHKAFQSAACGRVLITADTPAIREVFNDGAAVLVQPGCAEDLAQSITALADNESLRCHVAMKGAERIHTGYNPAMIARQFLDALANTVN
jgi:glycosyltransferase involved in cell wall biosynthesis